MRKRPRERRDRLTCFNGQGQAPITAKQGKSVDASNQNFQICGVTNVTSSQAMTAIPLPIER